MINIMVQNFVFIWYDIAYSNIMVQNMCLYGMIQHTVMTIVMAQWYCSSVLDFSLMAVCI